MSDKKIDARLWILRGLSILLMSGTVFIIWYGVKGERPRDFWSPRRVLSGANIYDMPGTWTDAEGKKRTLADFRGKSAVISFVFARCKMSCPRIIAELRRLDKHLNPGDGKPLYLIFLFDEVGKIRKEMPAFVKNYELTDERWHVLAARADVVKKLAKEFKLVYEDAPRNKYNYLHTNFFAVIGKDGRALEQIRGLPFDNKAFLRRMERALK